MTILVCSHFSLYLSDNREAELLTVLLLLVVRVFTGRVPGMMVFDVDMLKDILVKDALDFRNRYVRYSMFLYVTRLYQVQIMIDSSQLSKTCYEHAGG